MKIFKNGITQDSVTGQIYQVGKSADAIDAPAEPTPTSSSATTSDVYGNLNFETPEERKFREEQATADKTAATSTIDESTIRANTLSRFQSEIDALNRVYAEKKATEQLAGQGRMGSVAAVGARRGLIGSDFGIAQERGQEQANKEAIDAIENERLLKESAILSEARKYGDTEIANKTAAKKLGAENYLKYISESATRRQNNTNDIVKKLYDSGTGDTADYQTIADSLGVSVEVLKNTYAAYKKEQETAAATKKAEKEAALLKDGYSYVKTPAERDALKAKGYKIEEINGRTYSKIPKTTTKTVKVGNTQYTITTDEMGNIINKSVIGTSPSSGSNTSGKDEKAFEADLKAARKTLAEKGSEQWGPVYDYLVNQYGFTSDEDKYKLDQLLNKEMYTSK